MSGKQKQKRQKYTSFQTQTMWTYCDKGMDTLSANEIQQCSDEIGLTCVQVKQWINNHVNHPLRNKQDKPVGLNINNFHAFCTEYKEKEKFSGTDLTSYNLKRLAEYNLVKEDPDVSARLTAFCERRKNMDPEEMSEDEKKGIVQALFGALDKTCKQLAKFDVQTACTSFIKGSVPSVHSSPQLFNYIMRNEFPFLERAQKFLYGPTEDIRNMKRDVLMSVMRTKFNSLWHKANGYRTSGPPPYAAISLGDPHVFIIGLDKELKMKQPKDYKKEDFNLIMDHIDDIEIDVKERVPPGGSTEENVQVVNGTSESASTLLYNIENDLEESSTLEEELHQGESSAIRIIEFEVPVHALDSGVVTLDTNVDMPIPAVEKGKKTAGKRPLKRNANERVMRSSNKKNDLREEEEVPRSKIQRVSHDHPTDKENKPKKGKKTKNGRGSAKKKSVK